MNNIIGNNSLEDLFKILFLCTALLIFWIIETVRRNKKIEAVWILIFPPCILYFIIKYWQDTRGKCFFVVTFAAVVFLISAVTHYNFAERIWGILQIISIWPYHLFEYFKNLS